MKQLLAIILVLTVLLAGCSKRTPPQDLSVDSGADSEISVNSEQSDLEGESELPEEEPITKKLVVPEGFTLPRIGMRLEEMGVCTAAEFILAAQMGDFSGYPLIAMLEDDPNRCFNLEGYLYPDTYEIYTKENPDSIIRKMLANTEKKFDEQLRADIAASGFTVNEILVLASIIEKEAYERNDVPVPEEMPKVSSVLYNRLKRGMRLECNVTATYVIGAIDEFVAGGKDRYNEYYNTYYAVALPPGAICNPGMSAIKAAIFPAETDYLFFLTDKEKNFYYSSDYEEHKVLVAKYLGKEG